jgi:ketosteroid isomerase-like protein
MRNRYRTVLLCLFILSLGCLAQTKKPTTQASSTTGAPDKSYMQKIWDAWGTLEPANAAKFYASGPHTFFDIVPLKYGGWEEYQAGVKNVLAGYKSAKFTVNDDAAMHQHGDLAWGTATVKEEMTTNAGKVEMGNFRWTVIWEKEDGKWVIVHEHVSAPMG